MSSSPRSLIARAIALMFLLLALLSCGGQPGPEGRAGLRVLAVETFFADIAQNVAGERLPVQALLPIGDDPHSYEPTPADVIQVAECDVLIVNGAGVEDYLGDLLRNAGGQHLIITASAGNPNTLTDACRCAGAFPS